MLTISGKALGRKKPLFADFSVPAPASLANGAPISLSDLLAHIVRGEVAEFKERQAERRLFHALTARQIDAGLAAGAVRAGGSDLDQQVDPEQAIATALQAFTDRLFLVVVDDSEMEDLNAIVPLTPKSRLTFIRLTMLAGG